ncbi:MAG: LysR family transcriptional regulator [Firmicutes bacterium]|nr:LysR family transcriptional regulator [Bacillota bacterium]
MKSPVAANALTLQQLRVFVAYMQTGKTTAAAEELGIAQSSVVFHLNRLQEIAGVPLFAGRSSDVRGLTETGELLHHYARTICQLETQAAQALSAGREARASLIRVGATYTPGTYVLPEVMGRYRREHPHVQVQVEVDIGPRLIDKLTAHELDLALLPGTSADGLQRRRIQARSLIRDDLVVIVHPDAPLASAVSWEPGALEAVPMVLHEKGSGSRRITDEWAVRNGVRVTGLLETTATEMMKELVMAGVGTAVVSPMCCQREVAAGLLHARPLPGQVEARYLYLCHHSDRYASPALVAFEAEIAARLARTTRV